MKKLLDTAGRHGTQTPPRNLRQIPVIQRDHRLEPPLQQRVDDVMVVLYALGVGFVPLPLRVDAAPRDAHPKPLETGVLGKVGILLVP